jgi:hypothetical protein
MDLTNTQTQNDQYDYGCGRLMPCWSKKDEAVWRNGLVGRHCEVVGICAQCIATVEWLGQNMT